jgi:hypothetical protein
LAVRATPRPRKRKSAKAVTGDVLAEMLATCAIGRYRNILDRAILMVAFASDGRRRIEIAVLRLEQLAIGPPITIEDGPLLLSLHSSWSHKNIWVRSRRGGLSHRPACRGAECLDRGRAHRDRICVSEGGSLGQCFEEDARPQVGQ